MNTTQDRPPLAGGWVDREELWHWLSTHGATEGKKLERDNRTDGEYHHRWHHTSGASFDLNANWYAAYTFEPLVEWVGFHVVVQRLRVRRKASARWEAVA